MIKIMCEECKPLTNYESLISKTPEELARFLAEIRNGITCILGTKDGCLHPDDPCSECWLSWLKSPVEVQMSETVAKRRDNLRLMWIAENNWLKREPPIWKFWAWWRWKRERPVWEEVSE